MSWIQRDLIKESLAELADAPYQERLWLGEVGQSIGSLHEAMCQLFDDSGLGAALDAGTADSPVFGEAIDANLRQLDQLLQELAQGLRSPSELMADERMQTARGLASSALFGLVRLEAQESRGSG